jgi:hypothetical protein
VKAAGSTFLLTDGLLILGAYSMYYTRL